MAFRILMVGGGSGGHVYPLVAIARALKRQRPDVDIILMGDGPYVSRAAREAGVRASGIIAPKLRRYASAGNVFDLLKIPLALAQSLLKLLWYMPDVVLAKGGYTCAFPTFAARLYMIPVYLHESDAVPGLANRILARRSKLVFTSFPAADDVFAQMRRPTLLVGNPYRQELCCVEREPAHAALKLNPSRKTILIIGGSQGAQQLNDIVLNDLVRLVQKGYNIVHQSGDRNFKEVQKTIQQYLADGKDSYASLIGSQYRLYAFLGEGELAAAYGAADVVISRASAGVMTELASMGKPMVLVPLPGSANDHQAANAAELARYGAAVVDGVNATPSLVMAQVERLLDPAVAADVSKRLKTFVKPDAADRIATALLGA